MNMMMFTSLLLWHLAVLILVHTLGADGITMSRCSSKPFDEPLCRLNQISSITRVYLGWSDTGTCQPTPGDCIQNITADDDIFKEVITKCNGTSACHQTPYAASKWRRWCSSRWQYNTYLVIEYDCIPLYNEMVISMCRGQYFNRPLCEVGSFISVDGLYYGRRRPHNGNRCTPETTDCLYSISEKGDDYDDDLLNIKSRCDGRSACYDVAAPSYKYIYCNAPYWEELDYSVIQYRCIPHQYENIKDVRILPDRWPNGYLCDVGSVISVIDAYHVVPDTSGSSSDVSQSSDCVQPLRLNDLNSLRSDCNGRLSCLPRQYGAVEIPCDDKDIESDYINVIYTCYEAPYYELTCPGLVDDVIQRINCPGDDVNISISDVWLGFGTSVGCHVTTLDDVECMLKLEDTEGLSDTEDRCNGRNECDVNITKLTSSDVRCIQEHTEDAALQYVLTLYECRTELYQMRFCQGDSISLSCQDGAVIHVDKVMFGDFYYLRPSNPKRTCHALLGDYGGFYGRYHCEFDVMSHNLSYYHDVILACEGNRRCDEGLRAIQGPKIGKCEYVKGWRRNSYSPSDYVVVDYYCRSAERPVPTTDADMTTTYITHSTTSDEENSQNETSKARHGFRLQSDQLIYILVPVLGGLVLITIIVVTVVLCRKRRVKTPERHGSEPVQTTPEGNVYFDAPDYVAIGSDVTNGGDNNRRQNGHSANVHEHMYINSQVAMPSRANVDTSSTNHALRVDDELDIYENSPAGACVGKESDGSATSVSDLPTGDIYAQVQKKTKNAKPTGDEHGELSTENRNKEEAVYDTADDAPRALKACGGDITGSAVYSLAEGDQGDVDYSEVNRREKSSNQQHSVVHSRRTFEPDETVIVDNELYGKH